MQEKARRVRASEIVTLIFQRFFQRPKIKGNQDKKSFEKMNGTLICLVAGAIRHCLREYIIGDKILIEFKYETRASEWYIGRVMVKVEHSRLVLQTQ